MPAPLVSVIIPTCRRPLLVLRAAESVLNQTLREIEAIVVLDGADPQTAAALDSIGDPRLRAIVLPHSVGCAGARNAGVGEARADWVAFLDDDDEWLPRKLEIQMQTARQSPVTFPIVACRLIARSEQGDLVWPLRTPALDEPLSDYLFCQSGLRGGEGLILPSVILTTRDLLTRIPFRADLPRHNDVDWLLRAGALAGAQVKFVPYAEPLAVWHIETDRPRISNTTDWRYSLDWIRQNRALVTPRAYASFVLIWASSTAARGRAWKACWILPREAFALGSPRAADLLAHLMIWLIPQHVRSGLSVFLAGRGTKQWIRAGRDTQMAPDQKRISVALSTRNRAGVVAEAVRTILENDHPDFEAIVLDQSDNALTQTSLEPFLSDPRVRYIRSGSKGRSAGQNAAIREARGALVVMTDDDCTVPPNWLREFEAAFAIDGRIGIVFGNVLPAPHDGARGSIPAYVRQSPFLAGGIRDKIRVEGIGACMAVRRSVWRSLGGFDEMLGSGTRFRAGEDGDLAVRALFAGHWIYETPAVQVTHHGLRAWEQLPDLIESYWFGTGAMLAKPIAAGQWRILPLLVRLAVRWAFGRSLVGASLGSRPQRFRKLSAFCRGFFAGAACRVNKRTGLYVPATPACQGFVGKAT